MKTIIRTTDAPEAIGPYSQAVKAGGFLYISGQLPMNPADGSIHGTDIATQARQALSNLAAIVAAAGLSLDHVVKVNVYLADMNDFKAMNEVYAQFFTSDYPARAAVQVARLPKDALIEIEAVACEA